MSVVAWFGGVRVVVAVWVPPGGWRLGGGGGWERELCVVLLCVRVAGEMFAAAS